MSSAVSDDIEAIEQAVYVDTFAAAPPGLLRLSPIAVGTSVEPHFKRV